LVPPRPCVRVELVGGVALQCTPDHEVVCHDACSFYTSPAAQLQLEKDSVCVCRGREGDWHSMQLSDPPRSIPAEEAPRLAFLTLDDAYAAAFMALPMAHYGQHRSKHGISISVCSSPPLEHRPVFQSWGGMMLAPILPEGAEIRGVQQRRRSHSAPLLRPFATVSGCFAPWMGPRANEQEDDVSENMWSPANRPNTMLSSGFALSGATLPSFRERVSREGWQALPRDANGQLTSFGTLAHPDNCIVCWPHRNRPRGCKFGVFCDRCHGDHPDLKRRIRTRSRYSRTMETLDLSDSTTMQP